MSFVTTFSKLKQAYNATTNSQLAENLDTSRGAVEGWARRKEIPHKYLIKCTFDTGVSLDWLFDEDKPTYSNHGGVGYVNNVGNGGVGNYNNLNKEDNIDDVTPDKEENIIDELTLGLFKETYLKAKYNDDEIKRLRVYIMEYK